MKLKITDDHLDQQVDDDEFTFDSNIELNEQNQNANGGTEMMQRELASRIDPQLLDNFQIIASRVRNLDPNKIKIFWAHDLPGDPESDFLKTDCLCFSLAEDNI